ncbi:general transcription factor iih polypeptide 3 gtf2h3 [Cystoisospora suis]|uniref:General transcription factor iih polypeptide 3 gtf2h3 n=1 Tax=Cystoisospora suis TaxID=483139 RepID=A0A2C6KRA5_9APIC|nr:general transcription factor iih polypeptide 3 gtf2h3 [Cystoisospora suis]
MDRRSQGLSRTGTGSTPLSGIHCSEQPSLADLNTGNGGSSLTGERPDHRVKLEPSSPNSFGLYSRCQDPAQSRRLIPALSVAPEATAVSNGGSSESTRQTVVLCDPASSHLDQSSDCVDTLSSSEPMKGSTSRGEQTAGATQRAPTVAESLAGKTAGASETVSKARATVRVKAEPSDELFPESLSASRLARSAESVSVEGNTAPPNEESRAKEASPTGDSTVSRTGVATSSAQKKGRKMGEAVGQLVTCDAAVVVIVDLHPDVWREGRYAFQKPGGGTKPGGSTVKGNKQEAECSPAIEEVTRRRCAEKHALKDYLSFLHCALYGFVRALTLITPSSEVAVVGMNERRSALLVAGRVPNLLVEAAGLGGFFTKLMTRLARFSVNAESLSASSVAKPLLKPKDMAHGKTEHDFQCDWVRDNRQVKRVKVEPQEGSRQTTYPFALRVPLQTGLDEGLPGGTAYSTAKDDGTPRGNSWRSPALLSSDSMLAGALSLALCCLNTVTKKSVRSPERRVLILDGSSDRSYASQYMPLMNLAFAAAKGSPSFCFCSSFERSFQGVVVDCCALGPSPSTIPEQLCDISRGVHLKFSQAAPPATSGASFNGGLALLQFLLFWILPSVALRPAIAALSVHHRRSNTAVCFCHHKPVEVCCICSCCLAIYCSEKDSQTGKERISCDVCKSRFSRGLLRNKMAGEVDLPGF